MLIDQLAFKFVNSSMSRLSLLVFGQWSLEARPFPASDLSPSTFALEEIDRFPAFALVHVAPTRVLNSLQLKPRAPGY